MFREHRPLHPAGLPARTPRASPAQARDMARFGCTKRCQPCTAGMDQNLEFRSECTSTKFVIANLRSDAGRSERQPQANSTTGQPGAEPARDMAGAAKWLWAIGKRR